MTMLLDVLPAVGGLGLFLLGMLILTEGLKGLAGGALRRILTHFTKSPYSGAATGALTTAIIQSSSATTVAAIGFVGAGLMTFPMALGIIFGANIGTTLTGWVVAILGFKLNLGEVVLPLVLVGALMKMFGRGRWAQGGWALTGFSLLFIGIEALQSGMAPFEGAVTPETFPPDTLFGRLQLVFIGILITLVTQSSSAGVATALAALGAGAVSFPQAAAMVIGMDIGTTFTAALATIGGSTATRRTGYAHVIYNLMTGLMAFLLLTPYAAVATNWLDLSEAGDAQVAVVAFHTSFNAVGVLLVIGFTQPFARLIIHLVPERGPQLQRRLDDRLLQEPDAAIDAAAATLHDITDSLLDVLTDQLHPSEQDGVTHGHLQSIESALDGTRRYVEHIKTAPADGVVHERHQSVLHALDHLARLFYRASQSDRSDILRRDGPLHRSKESFLEAVMQARRSDEPIDIVAVFDQLRQQLRERRYEYRDLAISDAASGGLDAGHAKLLLDSMRWLHRSAYHLWRILFHLRRTQEDHPDPIIIADDTIIDDE